MATNAERQQAYRLRHLKDETGQGERLSVVVDSQAKRALERLAACYGEPQQAMLERLLQDAERALLGRAQAIPNGMADYCDSQLRLAVFTA